MAILCGNLSDKKINTVLWIVLAALYSIYPRCSLLEEQQLHKEGLGEGEGMGGIGRPRFTLLLFHFCWWRLAKENFWHINRSIPSILGNVAWAEADYFSDTFFDVLLLQHRKTVADCVTTKYLRQLFAGNLISSKFSGLLLWITAVCKVTIQCHTSLWLTINWLWSWECPVWQLSQHYW